MPTGNTKFQAAADEAACQFLLAAGGGAASFTAYSLLTGQLWAGAAGAAVTGIAAYAYGQGCQWDTSGADRPWDVALDCCPPNDGSGDQSKWWRLRYYRVSFDAWFYLPIGYSGSNSGQYNRCWIEPPAGPGQDGKWHLESCGVSYDTQGTLSANLFDPSYATDLYIVPPTGTGCDPSPPVPPGPYTYTDPDDGCQIQVSFESWVVDGGGSFSPVWRMDPILPARAAGGGVIGGCNFTPVIYHQPPGGGGGGRDVVLPIPDPPPGGDPWWLDALQNVLGNLGYSLVEKLLEKLFEETLPGGSVTIRAACEYKENGDPETFTVNYPEESWADRVLTALDADVAFQQQILLWKTPTCSGGGSSVTGDAVSINWVSDEYSPSGNNRLRKLLTYFDQNNTSLEATVTHWKDFTWNAGPVIVSCVGTPLGRPQVWANSVDEAKRVINHAAAIAGVDLTKAEWLVAPPKSSRYGMAGVMRVATGPSGQLSITKRDGASGLPEVLTPTSTPGSS